MKVCTEDGSGFLTLGLQRQAGLLKLRRTKGSEKTFAPSIPGGGVSFVTGDPGRLRLLQPSV